MCVDTFQNDHLGNMSLNPKWKDSEGYLPLFCLFSPSRTNFIHIMILHDESIQCYFHVGVWVKYWFLSGSCFFNDSPLMTLFPNWNYHLSSHISLNCSLKLKVSPNAGHWVSSLPSRAQTHRCLRKGIMGQVGGELPVLIQYVTCSWLLIQTTATEHEQQWQLLFKNILFKIWG